MAYVQTTHRKKGAPYPHTPEVQERSLETMVESFMVNIFYFYKIKTVGKHNQLTACLSLKLHNCEVIAQKGNRSSDMSRDHSKTRSQVDRAFSRC